MIKIVGMSGLAAKTIFRFRPIFPFKLLFVTTPFRNPVGMGILGRLDGPENSKMDE